MRLDPPTRPGNRWGSGSLRARARSGPLKAGDEQSAARDLARVPVRDGCPRPGWATGGFRIAFAPEPEGRPARGRGLTDRDLIAGAGPSVRGRTMTRLDNRWGSGSPLRQGPGGEDAAGLA